MTGYAPTAESLYEATAGDLLEFVRAPRIRRP